MKKLELYKKVGKKFIPHNDPWASEGLSNGEWLVTVRPGQVSMRNRLYTHDEDAKLDAALSRFHECLVKALQDAARLRPLNRKTSAKEIKAWSKFVAAMGKDMPFMGYGYMSYNDIAKNAILAWKQECHDAIRGELK